MKVKVTAECTSCELCVDSCPDVFEMGEDQAIVKVDEVPADMQDAVQEAAESCPVEAIEVSD